MRSTYPSEPAAGRAVAWLSMPGGAAAGVEPALSARDSRPWWMSCRWTMGGSDFCPALPPAS